MSDIPIRLSRKLRNLLLRLNRTKTILQKLQLLSTLRPSYLIPEVIPFQMLYCNTNHILVISMLSVKSEVINRQFETSCIETPFICTASSKIVL
jgi:hypothetical protein